MFFKLAVLTCVLAVALSAPAEEVAIISQDSDIQPDGTFVWSFESADGTKVEQSGAPAVHEIPAAANEGTSAQKVEVVQGSASFSDPEGGKHELTYTADENGYHPQSADIPVAPETPPQIARALQYIAEHPQAEEN